MRRMPFILPRLRPARAASGSLRLDDTARPTFPSSARLAVFTSLWIATVCNVPLWAAVLDLPGQGAAPHRLGFLLAFGAVVAAANVALLSLLGWRGVAKPAAAVLVVMAAFGAYFMLAYGVVIDAAMLTNVLQTDVHEAGDLLNWRLFATVGVLAARRCGGCGATRCRGAPCCGRRCTTRACLRRPLQWQCSACCWCSKSLRPPCATTRSCAT